MKNKQKSIFKWFLLGLTVSLVSHLILESLQQIGLPEAIQLNAPLFLLGSTLLFVFYSLFTALFGGSIIGALLLLIASLIIGIVNRVKIHYRADPLFPNDFKMIKEVPFLIEMIGWPATILIVIAIILSLIFSYRFYKRKIRPKRDASTKSQTVIRLLALIVSISAITYIGRFNHKNNQVKAIYSQYINEDNNQENGFIADFLSNLKGPPMEQPNNYSRETMEQLLLTYQEKAETINQDREGVLSNTNILYVMNESFSDPFNLEGLESNQDPIPYYRALAQKTLSGQVLSPTFGGGTATNEFQALTSFSMEPFNAHLTSPYVQLAEEMEKYPTVINRMSRLDYQTTAIHPYDPTFYERDLVYPQMGFDQFLHQNNMTYRESISEEHLYISDQSTYKELFEVLEQSPEPDFIHLVTMQNHIPYAVKYEENNYQVTGSGNEEEAAGYFMDLAQSDKALQYLIEQIDAFDEPILLVFWGDHLPGLYRGDIREQNSDFTLRQTPFLIYSNQQELQGNRGTISPIYFNSLVAETLQLKITPYEAMLKELEANLPVLDQGIYYDTNLEKRVDTREDLSEEVLEILEDYSLLMYDVTTGSNHADEIGFFLIP